MKNNNTRGRYPFFFSGKKLLASFFYLALLCSVQARAVEYALPDLDGDIQSLDQYRGKWVVVNYWASWCGSCLEEMPELVSLHEANRNGDIVVVGINFEHIGAGRLQRFVQEQSLSFPVLRSKPLAETPLGPVPALPTTYILDPSGELVAGQVGTVNRQELEAYIARMKASQAEPEAGP